MILATFWGSSFANLEMASILATSFAFILISSTPANSSSPEGTDVGTGGIYAVGAGFFFSLFKAMKKAIKDTKLNTSSATHFIYSA